MNRTILNYFLLVIFVLTYVKADERIRIVNGGYEGIVVAINRNIKPDHSTEIIDNLKDLFRHSSEFLYNITGGRAWFKNITLIIPESWPSVVDKIPYCYSDAHVKLGFTSPTTGDEPYTVQQNGCGEPGQFIYLTENFIVNLNTKTLAEYGRPEKHLIHQWAHLRYGVFDEHGMRDDDKYPAFYLEDGKVHPTSCSRNISGWAEKPDGSKCTIYNDGTVDYDCEFYADREANVEASLMYSPYLYSIKNFCAHDSGSKEHNRLAPNQQNDKCNGRSTCDVIIDNQDFKGKSIPAKPATLEPSYSIRKYGQQNVGKYVLVLDISGSMGGNGRLTSLAKAATAFITDIPLNNYIGIVTFSTNARIDHPLIQITNSNVRQELISKVPLNIEGGTSIGLGLLKGLEALKFNGQSAEGGVIILLTDGESNENLIPVVTTMKDEKVKVMCLALGPDASKQLETLTTETGGRMDKVSDGANAAIHIDTIFTSFTTCEDEDESISVINKLIDVNETIKHVSVLIDKELGKNTVIKISIGVGFQDHFSELKIEINSPNGTKYTCGDTLFTKDDVLKRCQLKLPLTDSGNFSVAIQKTTNVEIQVNVKVTSQTRDPNSLPISVKAWLNKIDINHGIEQPTIYVQVKKGSYPIINAYVVVNIESENNKQYKIVVKDSGNYDGIYIAIFTEATSDGRYSITADVTYTNTGTTRLVIANKGDTKPFRPLVNDKKRDDKPKNNFDPIDFIFNETKPIKQVKVEPLDPFIRVVNVGSVKISNYSVNNVHLQDVNDLKVASIRDDMHLIDIQWTQTNDDLFNGVSREVDIRVSKKKELLIDESIFLKQTKVTPEMIKFGELKAFKSENLQVVGIKLPDEFWTRNIDNKSLDIYIAMRTEDKNGNKAKISNIANAHVDYDLSNVLHATPPPGPEPVSELTETFIIDKPSVTKSFTIPEKYGVITEWKIFAGKIENFNFTLRSPDNKLFDETFGGFTKDYNSNIGRYHFEDALDGIWELNIKYGSNIKTFNQQMNVNVISSRRRTKNWFY